MGGGGRGGFLGGLVVVQHKIETCRLIGMKDTTSSNSDSKN